MYVPLPYFSSTVSILSERQAQWMSDSAIAYRQEANLSLGTADRTASQQTIYRVGHKKNRPLYYSV